MPIYEYVCDKCGQSFEVWQKMSEDALETHEGECGGPVRRVISATSFTLKGGGWYKDHYGLKGGGGSSSSGSGSASGSGSGGSSSGSGSSGSKASAA